MKRFRVLKLFVFVVLGLVAVLVADLGQALGETWLVPEENRMHAMVNDYRASRGLQRLDQNDALRWMGRRQSQEMAAAGSLFHNPSLAGDATSASLAWYALGENVGRGPDVDRIQSAFIASSTHHANLVHPSFTALGVGALADPASALFMTQVYAGLEAAPPPPPAPIAQPPPPPPPPPPPAPPAPVPPTVAPAVAASTPAATPSTEVQGTRAPTPAATPEGEPRAGTTEDPQRPERPSLIEMLLELATSFASKLAFWS